MIHFHANLIAEARCAACDRVHEIVCYVLKEELERLEHELGLLFVNRPGTPHVVLAACPGCTRYGPTDDDPLAPRHGKEGG